jgi:photosystem II stability/assembly factor-like uncharacterized protein
LAGDYGTILKTTDGGGSWSTLTTGVNYTLRGLDFPNENTGYAVTDYCSSTSYFLKTTDAGLNWTIKSLSCPLLANLAFITPDTGYAAGGFGKIMKTTDGGNTWSIQADFTNTSFHDLCFSDKNVGFACGTALTVKTTDAGLHWDTLFSGPLVFTRMVFINTQIGYALGYDWYSTTILYKTEDGGLTWSGSVIDDTNYDLYDLGFTDPDNGSIVGKNGVILKTGNGGGIITGAGKSSLPAVPDVIIYPNPCSDRIRVDLPESLTDPVDVDIYSMLGTAIFHQEFLQVRNLQITLPSLPPGTYLAKIRTGSEVIVKKLVVTGQ